MPSPARTTTQHGESVTSLSLTLNNVVACDLLTLAVAVNAISAVTITVADSNGNSQTWTSALLTSNGSGAILQTFYLGDAVGGTHTVTVTFSGTVANATAILTEWMGVAGIFFPLDGSNGNFGASGNPLSGNISTSGSDDLVYSVAAVLGAETLSSGSGYNANTSIASSTALKLWDEYCGTAAPPGTYQGTWAGGGSQVWLAQTFGFLGLLQSNWASPMTAVDEGDGSNAWALPTSIIDPSAGPEGSGPPSGWAIAESGLTNRTTNKLKATFAANSFASLAAPPQAERSPALGFRFGPKRNIRRSENKPTPSRFHSGVPILAKIRQRPLTFRIM